MFNLYFAKSRDSPMKGVFMFTIKILELTSKTGAPYKALEIIFPNGYTKRVYLDKAEQFCIDNNK